MVSPLSPIQSQAHPEPNLVSAAFLNSDLNSSNEPNAESMASERGPDGSADVLFGLMDSQKKQWFQYPPPLFLIPGESAHTDRISSMLEPSNSVPLIAAFNLAV
jgi:hypothetical protein